MNQLVPRSLAAQRFALSIIGRSWARLVLMACIFSLPQAHDKLNYGLYLLPSQLHQKSVLQCSDMRNIFTLSPFCTLICADDPKPSVAYDKQEKIVKELTEC